MENTESGKQNLNKIVPYRIEDFNNIPQMSVITCVNYWQTDIEHAIILRESNFRSSRSNEQMYELWSEQGYFARPISEIGHFLGNDDHKKSLLKSWKRRIS